MELSEQEWSKHFEAIAKPNTPLLVTIGEKSYTKKAQLVNEEGRFVEKEEVGIHYLIVEFMRLTWNPKSGPSLPHSRQSWTSWIDDFVQRSMQEKHPNYLLIRHTQPLDGGYGIQGRAVEVGYNYRDLDHRLPALVVASDTAPVGEVFKVARELGMHHNFLETRVKHGQRPLYINVE